MSTYMSTCVGLLYHVVRIQPLPSQTLADLPFSSPRALRQVWCPNFGVPLSTCIPPRSLQLAGPAVCNGVVLSCSLAWSLLYMQRMFFFSLFWIKRRQGVSGRSDSDPIWPWMRILWLHCLRAPSVSTSCRYSSRGKHRFRHSDAALNISHMATKRGQVLADSVESVESQ